MKAHFLLLLDSLVGALTNLHGRQEMRYFKRDVKPVIIASVAMFAFNRKPQAMKAYQDAYCWSSFVVDRSYRQVQLKTV